MEKSQPAESEYTQEHVSQQGESLEEFIASALRDQSDLLVDKWIEWYHRQPKLKTYRELPIEGLRDHIPPVLRRVADFLLMPIEAVQQELVDHLRTHAQLRRHQGYGIAQIVYEYNGLEEIVATAMLAELDRFPGDPTRGEVAKLFLKLRDALGEIMSVTIEGYRELQMRQEQELHNHLKEFGDILAHELKTPLQAILVSAEMLNHDELKVNAESRKRYQDVLLRGVHRIEELIDDVRLLALEGATWQDDENWIPARRIVTRVIADLEESAKAHGVTIEVMDPVDDICLNAAHANLILLNLVSNGIKYHDPAKTDRYVKIRLSKAGEAAAPLCKIEVADNGLGIDPVHRTQLFQAGFRAHIDVAEGTGYGLYIVKQVIESISGKIEFETEVDKGTTFKVTLNCLHRPAPGA